MERTYIEIQVPLSDQEGVAKEMEENGIEFSSSSSQGFDGNGVASFLVELAPHILTFLAGIYAERTKSRKWVKYKDEGVEITGVSEETLLEILRQRKQSEE